MVKKIRIYISGPITGTTDYMERFEEAEKRLNGANAEYSVINPAKVNSNMPKDTTHEEYMKMSICMLSMCFAIYMLKGWQKSPGACEEHLYALKHGIAILEE